jgi:peptide/nickel transport system permease protein
VWRLVAARVAQAAAIVAVVATVTFALIHLAPGDPFAAALDGPAVAPEVRAKWREKYGLDRPLPEQYVRYVANVARGDLGWSFSQHRPVADALATAIPNTLLLTGTALLLSFSLGILAALFQASRQGTLADRGTGAVLLVFYSVPDFWLALMAMLLFGYALPIFPVSGIVDPVMHEFMSGWGRVIDRLRHLVLPSLTLTLLTTAAIARHQRAALLDIAREDFVRSARAKGVAERTILWRHTLRNALGATITLLGLLLPALLGGAVFVESIFAWPGMGMLATTAVGMRDYALVTAVAIVGAAMVALGSLVADILTAAADPRLRDV